MKKRGDFTFFALGELVAAAVVIYLFINVATSYAKGEAYDKEYKAKEIALQIDALASVQGDAYFFNDRLSNYIIYFYPNRVEVLEEENDPTKGVYYFGKRLQKNSKFEKPRNLIIAKIGEEIIISKEMPNFDD